MEKRKIGSLEVSVVGLGCNNFGWRINASTTGKVVRAALDAGVNFFDTADRYATGQSEEFLGRAVRGRRAEVLLATKFGMEMEVPEERGASPAYVRTAIEASLRRLGTDYIDLYQLHQPDPDTPIADTLGALDALVQAGKVREIGCSNFSVAQLREAEEAAKGGTRFVSVQNQFSLFEREAETDVLPECERTGLAFLPFFPLANGLLTGKYRQGQKAPKGSRAREDWGPKVFTEENLATVEKLIAFCETRGHTILELAFGWLLAHRPVASVIAGASKPEQVRANAAAAGWQLSAEDLSEIDRIIPPHS